jgi:hypothetical protein
MQFFCKSVYSLWGRLQQTSFRGALPGHALARPLVSAYDLCACLHDFHYGTGSDTDANDNADNSPGVRGSVAQQITARQVPDELPDWVYPMTPERPLRQAPTNERTVLVLSPRADALVSMARPLVSDL